MKLESLLSANAHFTVTPCVGVWIETLNKFINFFFIFVTPCVGVWIETLRRAIGFWINKVTPCVGVWIETTNLSDSQVF